MAKTPVIPPQWIGFVPGKSIDNRLSAEPAVQKPQNLNRNPETSSTNPKAANARPREAERAVVANPHRDFEHVTPKLDTLHPKP
jgi:hypothetical protein